MEINFEGINLYFCFLISQLVISTGVNMNSELNFLHISNSCSDFTSNLFQELTSKQEDTENVASSSLSAYIILSLLLHGTDGETREEIKSGLNLNDLDKTQEELQSLFMHLNNVTDADLQLTNGIYVDSNFQLRDCFMSKSQEYYQTSVEKMIFQNSDVAANQINEWVKEKTKNKILNIISSNDIDKYTKVILINALYFKSSWLNPFESQFTEKRKFFNIDGIETYVPTMHKTFNVLHGHIKSLRSSFIKMKYLSKEFEMILILPDEKDGLRELEKNFDWNKISKASCLTTEVELFLPKFKVEATINLKSALKKLGMNAMFTERANFSRMAEKALYVDRVLQKIIVEVDEKGSEAAAATVAQIRSRRMVTDTDVFAVDHPFMFIIHHKPSSIPLFIGSIRKLGGNYKDEL
ncbi:antichymotrypsin-2 isoform X1 [Nasonia vitripennis]|uniref:Serpin domain-containing protein n=2 Tax=Nasonia vitripennis TaxID=7425 RepID=A0A7M7Q012_NASVI|nr:antichymotrypsin-2 isoform X1 [Nasonia vitripennis]XP_031779677.1 antichymotrypsin-2 isoform X1 [Nasonia vitripennis]